MRPKSLETSALAPWTPANYDGRMDPKTIAVASFWVYQAMTRAQPSAPPPILASYGETSEAIARAASEDPLFDGPDGAYRTAAILVALAEHESSFQPNVVGDRGRSYGLWQIQPPTARVSANQLVLPNDAAPIAIRLVRVSLRMCRERPAEERLAWYAQGRGSCKNEDPSPRALAASRRVLQRAGWLLYSVLPPGEAGSALLAKKR